MPVVWCPFPSSAAASESGREGKGVVPLRAGLVSVLCPCCSRTPDLGQTEGLHVPAVVGGQR